MRIGELATRSGCPVETIRHYERIGLLGPPPRTEGGYRDYALAQVDRLRFIVRGRDLGFSLDEIRSLLRLAEDAGLSCVEVDALARQHLAEIEQRARELRQMAQALRTTIAACRQGERGACTILDALRVAEPVARKRERRVPEVHARALSP